MGDAVEIDAGLDPFEFARDLGVEDELTRAETAHLLGREGDEDQRPHVAVAGKVVGDSANALWQQQSLRAHSFVAR